MCRSQNAIISIIVVILDRTHLYLIITSGVCHMGLVCLYLVHRVFARNQYDTEDELARTFLFKLLFVYLSY